MTGVDVAELIGTDNRNGWLIIRIDSEFWRLLGDFARKLDPNPRYDRFPDYWRVFEFLRDQLKADKPLAADNQTAIQIQPRQDTTLTLTVKNADDVRIV